MAIRYIVDARNLSNADAEALKRLIDRYAFITSYTNELKVYSVIWDLEQSIHDVISFPNSVLIHQ